VTSFKFWVVTNVYSQPGRCGGWRLVGGATTDLTGLNAQEAQALFLAAGTAQPDDPSLTTALRKLFVAMPDAFRSDIDMASRAIRVDPMSWGNGSNPERLAARTTRHVPEITDPIIGQRKLTIDYESQRSGRTQRVVEPLGLVAKRNVWYLVANSDRGMRTYRLSRIRSLAQRSDSFSRPANFDLDAVWRKVIRDVEAMRTTVSVRVKTDESALYALRWQFGSDSVRIVDSEHSGPQTLVDSDELCPVTVELRAQDYLSIAPRLAGYGKRVQLVDPPVELLDSIRIIAQELSDQYLS